MSMDKIEDLMKHIVKEIDDEINKVKVGSRQYDAEYQRDLANHLDDMALIRSALLKTDAYLHTDISRVTWHKARKRRRR